MVYRALKIGHGRTGWKDGRMVSVADQNAERIRLGSRRGSGSDGICKYLSCISFPYVTSMRLFANFVCIK